MDAAVIGAISGAIVALTGLIGAFTVLWKELKKNSATGERTEHLVNSRMDKMIEQQADDKTFRDTLITHLQDAGMAVPSDPTKEK